MMRSVALALCTLAGCGAPPPVAVASAPVPVAARPRPHDPLPPDFHAQEHELAEEEAQPAADHRPRVHHKHHRFERADEWVARFDDPARDAWQKPDEVITGLQLAPEAIVADLGAGTGYFAVRLARALPRGHVYAEDIEPDMIRHLGARAEREGLGNLGVVLGQPGDPKLPAAVDAAIMVDSYHHIADPTRFFGGLRERLKPGGRVVVIDFKKDAPDDAPGPPAAMRVADSIVVAHLRKLGYRLVRSDVELLPYQYILVFDLGAP